ncbi:hypothetical protein ACFHYQ_17165 [Sphaerimonospora cavernae]|uniref:Uncharacterized protein n=1 Tax=Sphaerimonospora cavernae TaxID=1740611 RepID=A0ABV6U6E7_9ACTN
MSIPPRPGPDWRFNAPPGWPSPPDGWAPTAAWAGPEDDWPEAPPYWKWWVRDPTDATAATPPDLTPATAVMPPDPAPATSIGVPPTLIQPETSTLVRLRVPLIATALAAMVIAGTLVVVNLQRAHTPEADSTRSAAQSQEQASAEAAQATMAPLADPSESAESESEAGTTAYGQAAAIDALLDRSEPSRGALQRAINQILRCSGVSKGVSAIEKVTRQRGEQAGQAKKLDVDALDDGYELKDTLVRALTASHRADKAYLKWAKRFRASGCRGRTVGDSAFDAGNRASESATAAKTEFVYLWNPIAREHGLPTRREAEI